LSGEVNRLIEDAENIYAFKDNQMKRLKKDRELIYDLMADKRSEMALKQQSVNPNLKNITELVNLVKFYNSLF
jgi:hypothetical protein